MTALLLLAGCQSNGIDSDLAAAQAQQNAFTQVCNDSAGESIKRFPTTVDRIYLSPPSKVKGAWSFELFYGIPPPRIWAHAELMEGPAPVDVAHAPGAYEVRYTHLPVIREAGGSKLTFNGVRQEIIDLSTGEVIAQRQNYLWGQDFNRGWFCMGIEWFLGNDGFVDRVLGYRYRHESPRQSIPEQTVMARALERRTVDVDLPEYRAEQSLPPGFDYKDRPFMILPNGSKTRMHTYRVIGPLSIVSVMESEAAYWFVELPHGSPRNWPLRQIMLFRRDKSGVPIDKVYIQLPLFVDWSNGWGVRPQDIRLENGTVRIGIHGKKRWTDKYSGNYNRGHYAARYEFVADVPD